MASTQIDYDPFAAKAGTPVEHDPFAKPKFEAQEDTVYSPEGVALVTPTTQAAPSGAAGTAAKVATDIVGAPVRAAMSLAKPAANVLSWMGMEEPAKAISQIDKGIKAQGPEFMGVQGPIGTAASIAGDIQIYNKLLGLLGKAGTAAGGKSDIAKEIVQFVAARPWLQSTLGGGAVGVLGTESPAEAIKEGAIGAGLGAVTHGALTGLGSALNPVLQRVKDLQAKGFTLDEIKRDTTIGQMLGGGMQAVENFFAALPFSGAMTKIEKGAESLAKTAKDKAELMKIADEAAATGMKTARDTGAKTAKSILDKEHADLNARHTSFFENRANALAAEEENFSRDQINKALSHIGEKLDPGLKGTQAIAQAQEKISNAYKTPLSEIGDVRLSDEAETSLRNLAEQHKAEMVGTKGPSILDAEVDKLINTAGDSRLMSAEKWHTLLKSLGTKAQNFSTSSSAEERELGQALKDLRNEWADLVDSEGIRAANRAHSLFQPAQKAASYIKSVADQGGVFDPKQYLTAIKSESTTKRFAGGVHPEQANAVAAYENMVARREAEKAFESKAKDQMKSKMSQDKKDLADKIKQQNANMKAQADYLKAQSEAKQKLLKEGTTEATGMLKDIAPYAGRRLGYQALGLTGSGGLGGIGTLLGVSPEATALAAGIPWAGSQALYTLGLQNLLKKGALAPRPEAIREIGKAIQQTAPLGALSTVQAYKEARKRPGVQVIDPTTGKEITKP